jgi:hypothetical protein
MIYFMQRVLHVHMEYAHIQDCQEHLQVSGVDVGTFRWVHEGWHALHVSYDLAKVLLINLHQVP